MPWYEGDSRTLAAYAAPEAAFVQEIVRSAEPRLVARTGREFDSFPKAAAAGAVLASAWVLYDELLMAKPAIEFDRTPRVFGGAQEFRAVQDIRASRSANCLESALLFSSCALQASLNPVLLIVNAGELDHVMVGLWLGELGSRRDRACEPDGTLAASAVPGLIGSERFADSYAYWNGLDDADMLVVDCSGMALGYPKRIGQSGLNFEAAVAHAWNLFSVEKTPIRAAIDLRQAQHKMPFPTRSRPHIIGREDDVKDLAAAAASTNIVLHGSFGMGKSVLALALRLRVSAPLSAWNLLAQCRGSRTRPGATR